MIGNDQRWERVEMGKAIIPVRRRSVIQAGLALGASQFLGAPFILTARGDELVKIGMVNPLTGVLSALAQSEVDGARYAEAEINKNGGILGRPVQLLIEDSANDVGEVVVGGVAAVPVLHALPAPGVQRVEYVVRQDVAVPVGSAL